MKVYLNNKFIDEEKATINIKDRGLLLGDSIFDTLLYNKNKLSLIVQLKENIWNNKKNLQLIVLDTIIDSNKA